MKEKMKRLFGFIGECIQTLALLIIVGLVIFLIFNMDMEWINFEYYDKFCEYLKTNSTAYDTCSEKQMKEYYRSWANNTGFADIIVGIDGELEDAFWGTEDIIQFTDVADLNQGIYIYNDDEYSHIILLSMSSLSEGRLTMIRADLTNCYYHTVFSTSIYQELENKYRIHDSKDIYLEFTDYGTIIITNGSGETYIDEHTLPDAFTGEYLPIHSF